jgi:gamma-glutamyltranspeptidase / glutathione hydrolase
VFRTGRPTTLAFDGMVATPHTLASAAGLDVLREGGTALDAVVAANAVLTVVYPDQTSIGGDCFLIYYDAATKKLHGLNGSGRSPKTLDVESIRTQFDGVMPRRGIHTVTVPGAIDAWITAHERFGRLEFARLLQPAIGYARNGFPVSPNVADGITWHLERGDPSDVTRCIYAPNGRAPRAGERLALPELAHSLELIAREGRDVFYNGEIAERIVATSQKLGGSFALDDLDSHQAEWVEPLTTTYRGVTVAELPPNSQGLTALIALNLAEQQSASGRGSADQLHTLIEATKLAFGVRDELLADPEFVTIDADKLCSKPFARELWKHFDRSVTTSGFPLKAGDTVYLCAIDRDGNAASLIQSIYLNFGSGVIADGTGIVLQCRGAYFNLDEMHPNRLEPCKRPLHTLMPAMLLKNGELLGPIGTQGGDAQAQVQLQLTTNLVDYGMEPQQAVETRRWVVGGAPGQVTLEAGFDDSTKHDLWKRGHAVVETGKWDINFGHAQMILRDPETGLLKGAADPRADGVALGI